MGLIDVTLAPIKQLQKLSNSEFGVATFATSQPEQIVQFTVDLVNELKRVRNDLKSLCNSIEHLSDDFYIPATPCLATEIKDLKCKIDNFVTTKPEPLDYSKLDFTEPIAQAVAKAPQFKPAESVNHDKLLKQRNEEQLRSNNLIIYNVSYDKVNPVMALKYAKDYFNSCGVTSYYLEQEKIVDAQFLSISEDRRTCSLRVVMSNPWVVRALLSDARKLKTTDSTSYRGQAFDFTKTYISKDMTKAEQDKHRLLILELKNKIRDYPSTKWIIQFGRVQDGGEFIKRP